MAAASANECPAADALVAERRSSVAVIVAASLPVSRAGRDRISSVVTGERTTNRGQAMAFPDPDGLVYVERLTRRLAASGNRPCLRHDGQDVVADDFLAKIHRYARTLNGLGLGRGDVVALLAPNHPDALAIRYGAQIIGAAATFLSVPSAPADRAQLIGSIDPKLLVVFPETYRFVPSEIVVALAGVGLTPDNGLRLDELAACQSGDPVDCRARPEDLAVIISSGGSTGVPKGSWRSFATYTTMVAVPSPEDRRQLVNGPFAYLSQVLVDITLLGGGTVVLKDHYEPADTLETITAERITDLFLVEPQLFELMDHPSLESADLSSLRTLTHIGASAPPTLRLRAHRRFGPKIVHAYGASEEGLVSVSTPVDTDLASTESLQSAGRILPRVEVRLRRDDGAIAAAGETGNIEVRSPAMAQGYRNRPDLETTAFRNGWYRSGDLGRIDADGYLHIHGRTVDIAMVDGRMVTPTLIEETLCRLPEVRYASMVVDQDRTHRVAVVIPWPGMTIDCAACLDAVAAEYGEAVTRSLLLLPRNTIPLTRQGKPDREAIHALGRAAIAGTPSTLRSQAQLSGGDRPPPPG
jgi:fatty-acyl-CoA synthase